MTAPRRPGGRASPGRLWTCCDIWVSGWARAAGVERHGGRALGRGGRSADQPAGLCDGAAAAAAAKPYDGGQPTGAPDRTGKPITVVDVPKLIGIGYFNATTKGMQDAAAELGNVTVTTDGPTEANIDEQITFIDNYITRGVDGILFAANDPVAIAPVLKKALGEGHQRRRLRRQLDARRARSGSSTRPSSTASARR